MVPTPRGAVPDQGEPRRSLRRVSSHLLADERYREVAIDEPHVDPKVVDAEALSG